MQYLKMLSFSRYRVTYLTYDYASKWILHGKAKAEARKNYQIYFEVPSLLLGAIRMFSVESSEITLFQALPIHKV